MRSHLNLVLALLAACILLTGCWQAKVTTNREPGNKVVQEKWAPSFLYGLIGAEVDVSGECPNGIASAERIIRVPNGIVGLITLNIYFPQTVTVTCAAGGSMSSAVPLKKNIVVPSNATNAERQKALMDAAMQSRLAQKPATVHVVTN